MTEPQPPADDVFDLDRIRSLIELMKEHDLSEIDLQQEEQRIRLSRGGRAVAAPQFMPVPPPTVAAFAAPDLPRPDDAHLVIIRSPMVGTFYLRPNPNAEPFVKVGEHVDEEKTICIIEAMKVFNEIPAETRGQIVAILAEDEEAVDFGKPLFKVDTSK